MADIKGVCEGDDRLELLFADSQVFLINRTSYKYEAR